MLSQKYCYEKIYQPDCNVMNLSTYIYNVYSGNLLNSASVNAALNMLVYKFIELLKMLNM